MKIGVFILLAVWLGLTARVCAQTPPNGTKLFQNLQRLGTAYNVNNPAVASLSGTEGPKGLAAADFDGDGRNDLAAANHDGTVAILFGAPAGGFEPVRYQIAGNPRGLRDVIAANVMGDSRPEIIAAHPFEGKLYIFSIAGGPGSRTFGPPLVVTTWPGARGLTAGDFDGDGKMDLAVGGAGDGFREYRGDGAGGFAAQEPLAAINAGPPRMVNGAIDSAKPVFTMHAWRKAGETQDRLAVTFAGAGYIWFLSSQGAATGQSLQVESFIPLQNEESVYDLTMDKVSAASRVTGEPDLITAATWSGEVFIRIHQAPGNPFPYATVPDVRVAVPGAPRAVCTADVDGDTWPDLLVASRAGNSLSVYHNAGGTLSLSSQTPAGSSPRDVVCADFDGNGKPDAAVINRDSKDISVHLIDPATGWFLESPMIQNIPGGALALSIVNLDGGPRSELLFLTRATGEANIMKIGVDSRWLPPVRYHMGVRPETLSTPDLNGDGRPDLLATSSGDWQTPGGLTYRYQLADHTFGPLFKAEVPGNPVYTTYAAIARDFNGDGYADLITAGYFDSQAQFFEGTAGGLVYRRSATIAPYTRTLVAADFDQDGDLDLVAAGAYGELTVLENNGAWFTGGTVSTQTFTGVLESGAYSVKIEDRNGDGDPDLTVLGVNSVTQWNGGTGLSFYSTGTTPLQPTLGAGETLFDYDGDGVADTFALCPSVTSASFFKGVPGSNGQWWNTSFVSYAVPSSQELASGDLDGDGRPDLAGAGEHLWAALSAAPAPPPVATPSPSVVPDIAAVTINEVLASANNFIAPGSNKSVDCVEIFNGSGSPVDLNGWILRLDPLPGQTREDFIFPGITLPPRGLAVVYCAEKTGDWQAPFKLPAEGGTLHLINAGGVESDLLTYPPQQQDISYARIFDGSRNFVYSPFPGIGSTNYDNGNVEPKVNFKGVDTGLLQTGTWRFRASAWDDSGMQSMSIQWRVISGGTGTPPAGVVPLYDDGQHDDGAALDGTYAGDFQPPFPPGTGIEFFLTGTDRLWQSSTLPDGPQFTAPGQLIQNYSLSLPLVKSGWEISEVVSKNLMSLVDADGEHPDWAEIRYAGLEAAPVAGLYLSDSLFDLKPSKLYDISRLGTMVTPGTTQVVILDGQADSGANANHGPFAVNSDGDSIFLIHLLPSGATELVDVVKVPALGTDVAWARLGVHGPFVEAKATPFAPNAPPEGVIRIQPGLSGGEEVIVGFSGAGRVEASSNLGSWTTVLPSVPDTGFEHAWREPVQSRRFFRIR